MRKIFAIAVVALLGPAAFAAGEVYRWKDAIGTWHYSDQPQPGAELVRGNRRATALPGTPAPMPVSAPVPSAATSDALPLPVSKEVAQEVRQEAATEKAKLCEKAKADYDRYVRALSISRTDSKGNQVYMTDAEIDATRLQARSIRDLACGS